MPPRENFRTLIKNCPPALVEATAQGTAAGIASLFPLSFVRAYQIQKMNPANANTPSRGIFSQLIKGVSANPQEFCKGVALPFASRQVWCSGLFCTMLFSTQRELKKHIDPQTSAVVSGLATGTAESVLSPLEVAEITNAQGKGQGVLKPLNFLRNPELLPQLKEVSKGSLFRNPIGWISAGLAAEYAEAHHLSERNTLLVGMVAGMLGNVASQPIDKCMVEAVDTKQKFLAVSAEKIGEVFTALSEGNLAPLAKLYKGFGPRTIIMGGLTAVAVGVTTKLSSMER